ncbi:MAG: hypothetical protein KAV00_18600, partial [Phycisphaerae bacterium]|nr:hypothetical protein [Phycisphaerae bacterium]
ARLTALRQAGAGVPTIAAGGISSWGGGEMNEADRMEMNALSHTLANATDPVQRQRIMQQIQDLRRRIAGEPVQPQGKPVASTVGSPTDQPLTEGERERMANISQRVVNEIKKPETGFWTVFEGGASDVLNRQADDLVTNITGILDSAPPMRRRQVARDIATRVGHSELLDDIKSFRNWSLLDTINIAASGNKFTAKDAKKFADKLQKIYDLLAKELGR